MSRRTRILLIALATVVVVAAVASVAVWFLAGRSPDARETAARYASALESGDDASLAPLLDPDLPAATVAARASAFAGATARPVDVRLGDLVEDEDTARVAATATMRGEPITIDIMLVRTEGAWHLDDDTLPVLDVSTTLGTQVTVGDAVVPTGTVRLLPAVYPVMASPADLVSGTAEVSLVANETTTVQIEAHYSAHATVAAQSALEAYATDCTAPSTSVAPRCGLAVPWGVEIAELESVAYRIEQMPALQIRDDATFSATGGSYTVTARGTGHDGEPTTVTYRDDSWELRGGVDLEGDTVTLSAW